MDCDVDCDTGLLRLAGLGFHRSHLSGKQVVKLGIFTSSSSPLNSIIQSHLQFCCRPSAVASHICLYLQWIKWISSSILSLHSSCSPSPQTQQVFPGYQPCLLRKQVEQQRMQVVFKIFTLPSFLHI